MIFPTNKSYKKQQHATLTRRRSDGRERRRRLPKRSTLSIASTYTKYKQHCFVECCTTICTGIISNNGWEKVLWEYSLFVLLNVGFFTMLKNGLTKMWRTRLYEFHVFSVHFQIFRPEDQVFMSLPSLPFPSLPKRK